MNDDVERLAALRTLIQETINSGRPLDALTGAEIMSLADTPDNNVVACVSCKQPVRVTALNAIRCERCSEAPPTAALRERDALWCKALLSTLDTDEVESVMRWFNEHRPDAALARAEGEAREPDDELADAHQTALEVLCRVFDDGADAAHDEWLAWYKPTEWLHFSRALGAFIRLRFEKQQVAPAPDVIPEEPWRVESCEGVNGWGYLVVGPMHSFILADEREALAVRDALNRCVAERKEEI